MPPSTRPIHGRRTRRPEIVFGVLLAVLMSVSIATAAGTPHPAMPEATLLLVDAVDDAAEPDAVYAAIAAPSVDALPLTAATCVVLADSAEAAEEAASEDGVGDGKIVRAVLNDADWAGLRGVDGAALVSFRATGEDLVPQVRPARTGKAVAVSDPDTCRGADRAAIDLAAAPR